MSEPRAGDRPGPGIAQIDDPTHTARSTPPGQPRDQVRRVRRSATDQHIRPELRELTARNGLALVLAQQQEYQVPAKLYELVGLGIPTLVVAEEGSAAGSEATRLGAWRVDENDVAGLTEVLAAAWRDVGKTPRRSAVRVDYMAIAADADQVLRGTAPADDSGFNRSRPDLDLLTGEVVAATHQGPRSSLGNHH